MSSFYRFVRSLSSPQLWRTARVLQLRVVQAFRTNLEDFDTDRRSMCSVHSAGSLKMSYSLMAPHRPIDALHADELIKSAGGEGAGARRVSSLLQRTSPQPYPYYHHAQVPSPSRNSTTASVSPGAIAVPDASPTTASRAVNLATGAPDLRST